MDWQLIGVADWLFTYGAKRLLQFLTEVSPFPLMRKYLDKNLISSNGHPAQGHCRRAAPPEHIHADLEYFFYPLCDKRFLIGVTWGAPQQAEMQRLDWI